MTSLVKWVHLTQEQHQHGFYNQISSKTGTEKKHSGSVISNLLLLEILIAMIGLSAIGVIILVHPEGQELQINILNS